MENNIIKVENNVIEQDMEFNGEILLSYKIEYPEFISIRFSNCLSRINKFYKDRALKFKRYYETELFGMAIQQYKEDLKEGFPIRMYGAAQMYQITYLQSCIISLYYDQYEYTGGAHGNTIRSAQTWQLHKCGMLKLDELVHCPPDFKSYILSAVNKQIEKEPDIYFQNYKDLASETFNKNSFYCTPQGIKVFYQQYDIAPYSSGIREFVIPYSNCVTNPEKMCYLFIP